MLKKIFNFLAVVLTVIFLLPLASCNAQQLRHKSSVLTVYVNNSGTTYNKELDKIVNAELKKRLEGLYIELDNEAYTDVFREHPVIEAEKYEIIPLADKSGADYFIYIELLPFIEKSDYNFVYHNKAMTSSVFVWIIDLKTNREIIREVFSLKEKDSTDAWFIGDKSVAIKSLKSTMFKVGEHVSAKLPL